MKNYMFVYTLSLLFILLLIGCAESGDDGDAGIDCGEYGSAHDGHCHCLEGYAFNGGTCVALNSITTICAAHDNDTEDAEDTDEHAHEDDSDFHEGDSEHEHEHEDQNEACVCSGAAECGCDGNLVSQGSNTYCIPERHEDDELK